MERNVARRETQALSHSHSALQTTLRETFIVSSSVIAIGVNFDRIDLMGKQVLKECMWWNGSTEFDVKGPEIFISLQAA
jgi:hypothetical protein